MRDNRTGALGITFWRAGSIEGFQSNAPAVVYASTTAREHMRVDAADPNGERDRLVSVDDPRSVEDDRRAVVTHHALDHADDSAQGGETTTVLLTGAGAAQSGRQAIGRIGPIGRIDL